MADGKGAIVAVVAVVAIAIVASSGKKAPPSSVDPPPPDPYDPPPPDPYDPPPPDPYDPPPPPDPPAAGDMAGIHNGIQWGVAADTAGEYGSGYWIWILNQNGAWLDEGAELSADAARNAAITAINDFSSGNGEDPPPYVPPDPPPGNDIPPPIFVDRRADADQDSLSSRRPRIIDPVGVTVHQMGVSRSGDPDKLLEVHAHFVVLRDGRILQLFDLDQRVANSQYAKSHVQIEVEGNFQNSRNGKWQKPGGENMLNPEQVVGLRRLLVYLEQELRRNDDGFLELTGHIMAAAPIRRGNDPGPEVWQAAAWVLDRPLWTMGPVLSQHDGVEMPEKWWTYVAKPPGEVGV